MTNIDEERTRAEISEQEIFYRDLIANEPDNKEKRQLNIEKNYTLEKLYARLKSIKDNPNTVYDSAPTNITVQTIKPQNVPIWITGQEFNRWLTELEVWQTKDTRNENGQYCALIVTKN